MEKNVSIKPSNPVESNLWIVIGRVSSNLANSGHILLKKKITIHGCDTFMEYLKTGLLGAYPFKCLTLLLILLNITRIYRTGKISKLIEQSLKNDIFLSQKYSFLWNFQNPELHCRGKQQTPGKLLDSCI